MADSLSPEEVAARALYPNTYPSEKSEAPVTETAKETPAAGSAEAVGLALSPTMRDKPAQDESTAPENIQELRKADPDHGRYAAVDAGVGDALHDVAVPPEVLDQVAQKHGLTGEKAAEFVRQSASRELAEIFADHGLAHAEARELVSIARQVAKDPPSDEVQAKWIEQAERRLKEIYGADMQQAVADARTLVARDPRVGKILEHTRLGNNPQVIELMARVARSERLKGRLGTIVKSEKTAAQSLFANSNMNP